MTPARHPTASRRRLRRGRAARVPRGRAVRPRHALRGRRPRGGPRRHPRRAGLAIDTGFIVHNQRTYPTLLRLFAELGVETQESEMSLSVRDDETGSGVGRRARSARALPGAGEPPSPGIPADADRDPRFHRRARRPALDRDVTTGEDQTLREFLAEGRFSAYFARHFMEPVVAAVWSTDPALALDYPARYLFTFLEHHGMLTVFGSPTWRTVTGGSRDLRRPGRGRAPRHPHRHQGHLRARDADRRRRHRRQRRGRDVRRVHRRHAPRPGPRHARRAHRAPARGARGAALLRQHRAAPHRHLAAAASPRRPRVLELPPRRRRRPRAGAPSPTTSPGCSGSPPTPATSSRSAATTSSTPTPSSPGATTPTRCTRPPRWRPAGGSPRSPPTGSPSPAPTTAGASTRTVRARGWPQPSASASRGRGATGGRAGRLATVTPTACANPRRSTHHDHPHPPRAVPAYLHPPFPHLAGRPRPPAGPRVLGTFEARDHLGDPELSIRENVEALLARPRHRTRRRPGR